MQLSYWSSTPGSHLRLPDWPSKLKTLSMLELVTLVMTLYGVVYSSPAGAQCHLGMAATTHGSLQKGKKKKPISMSCYFCSYYCRFTSELTQKSDH